MRNIERKVTPLEEKKRSRTPVAASPPDLEAELASLESLADWLDTKFVIPGTNLRFGLDAVLGLIPGIGDTLTAIPAGHIVLTAQRLGAPTHVILRMVGNIGLDWMVGLVPMLGDVLDAGFKANRRNVALLREHFGVPGRRQ